MVADSLVEAYQAQQASLTGRVVAYVEAAWGAMPAVRDADVAAFVARVAPVVESGQMQAARLANAYMGRAAVMDGVEYEPVPVERDVIDYRGVPKDEVYRRPAVKTYTELSKGKPFDVAIAAGGLQLVGMVAMDLAQASNRQTTAAMKGSGYKYFVRYLTGKEDCALCVIASTQRYTRGDLMPIHPACDCRVKPMTSRTDPGQIVNQELLDATHAEIERHLGASDRGARDLGLGKTGSKGQDISDYTELMIVREHGEYGPTLAWRSHNFTGPGDIAAD